MYTLLHRSFTFVSDFSKFHFEVETFTKTLHKNTYATKFVDKWIAKFVNSIFIQKTFFTTVPKLKLRIVLPYLGDISTITKKRLSRCISKRLKICKLQIVFQTGNRLNNYLDLEIVFLKPYNLTLSINLSMEAAQLPITVKPTDI